MLTATLLARKGEARPSLAATAFNNPTLVRLADQRPAPPPAPVPAIFPTEGAAAVARAAQSGGRRIGVRLRLDGERFLRLKVFAARTHRTSQDVLQAALDAYLDANGPAVAGNCACLAGDGPCQHG
jgi:hypothetical protein